MLILDTISLQYIAPLNWLTHDILVENVCLKKHSHSLELLVFSNIEEDETILENGGTSWFYFYHTTKI